MTIPAETSSVEYSGNGVTTQFAYTFKVFDKTHLLVTLIDSDGVRTVQTVDVDYTVDGVGATAGGNVTFNTAPSSGYTVLIELEVPLTQPTDLKNQGAYYPEQVENALDRANMQIRQTDRKLQASLRIPGGEDNYDAGGVRIVDLADGVDATDAATVGQLDEVLQALGAGIAGTTVVTASGTGDGANVNLSFPGITVSVDAAYLLVVGGVLQKPTTDFNVDVANHRLVVTTAVPNGVPWFAICIGHERAINVLSAGSVGTAQLDDEAVTLAKMQNIATDTILGRSTAGTGDIELLTCLALGRSILAAANAAAVRTLIGAAASASTYTSAQVDALLAAAAASNAVTQAGAATDKFVTPASLFSFAKSTGSGEWSFMIPGTNIIVKVGTATMVGGTYDDISFAAAFPTRGRAVFTQRIATGDGQEGSVLLVRNLTTTGFRVTHSGTPSSPGIYWLAFGE